MKKRITLRRSRATITVPHIDITPKNELDHALTFGAGFKLKRKSKGEASVEVSVSAVDAIADE